MTQAQTGGRQAGMSSYMVDSKHIVYLVEAAISHRLAEGDGGSISWFHAGKWSELRTLAPVTEKVAVGAMLWRENENSVNDRYPVSREDLPGANADADAGYTIRPAAFSRILADFDPVQVLKSCACYTYQSCDHEGWEASEAHAFIEALKTKAIHALPGYDAAEWGYPVK